MKITETKIKGAYIIEPDVFEDVRGTFIKPFNKDIFIANGLVHNFEENFYSISKKDAIRGMHFQKAPCAMAKLIYASCGSILDVVLDLRKGSPTYGQHFSIEISGSNHLAVYLPIGCAHGFLSLEDNTCIVYLQEKVYSAENEGGVHVDSFGMDWGKVKVIISKKDSEFPPLKAFDSPFDYNENK
jgi:dTDP-4-dehydrorhamnose 3,5-epimerase